MSSRTKTISVWSVLRKILKILFLPPFATLMLLFALVSCLIDLVSKESDKEFLSDKEVRKREVDRNNKRRHNYLNHVFDYVKSIF